jgi:hypothetical protein
MKQPNEKLKRRQPKIQQTPTKISAGMQNNIQILTGKNIYVVLYGSRPHHITLSHVRRGRYVQIIKTKKLCSAGNYADKIES